MQPRKKRKEKQKMKRQQLIDLGIEADKIDAIMDINGSDIERHKSEVDALNKDLTDAQKTIDDMQKSSADAETVKKQADEYKEKYEAEKEDREKELKRHSSELALIQAGANDKYRDFLIAQIQDTEDVQERVADLKDEYSELFAKDEQEPENGYKVKDTKLEKGNKTTMTKEDIMAVEDIRKRQKLIQEHGHLFI